MERPEFQNFKKERDTKSVPKMGGEKGEKEIKS